MCVLYLTELLTLTIFGGLPLSGPLQKISNKQIQFTITLKSILRNMLHIK